MADDDDLEAMFGDEGLDASHYLPVVGVRQHNPSTRPPSPPTSDFLPPPPSYADVAPPAYRPDLISKASLATGFVKGPSLAVIPPVRPQRTLVNPSGTISTNQANGSNIPIGEGTDSSGKGQNRTGQSGNMSFSGGGGPGTGPIHAIGGGGGNGPASGGRGGPKKDNNGGGLNLPEAPTLKPNMTANEEAQWKSEQERRKQIEKANKARIEQAEAQKRSETRLFELRREHEKGLIAERRVEEYMARRHRQEILARECARRMTYPLATHESRVPPPQNTQVAHELEHLSFRDGWHSLFAAFGVGGGELMRCIEADEEFNKHLTLTGTQLVDAVLVKDYMAMVLQGSSASPLVRSIIPDPLPEQYDPDPVLRVSLFALGRCLKAVPEVFKSLMMYQMDILSDTRRGKLTENDCARLLNTAKGHVTSVCGIALGVLLARYPKIMGPMAFPGVRSSSSSSFDYQSMISPNHGPVIAGSQSTFSVPGQSANQARSGGPTTRPGPSRLKQDPRVETRLFVRERLQEALVGLFDRGLGLFYYQVFAPQDRSVLALAAAWKQESLLDIATERFGLGVDTKVAARLVADQRMETFIVDAFKQSIEVVCGPALRLGLFVDAMQLMGELEVSGDELLPLVAAALVLGVARSEKQIRLASLLNMMDDFALPEEFKSGQNGFVCSTLLMALEVLIVEGEVNSSTANDGKVVNRELTKDSHVNVLPPARELSAPSETRPAESVELDPVFGHIQTSDMPLNENTIQTTDVPVQVDEINLGIQSEDQVLGVEPSIDARGMIIPTLENGGTINDVDLNVIDLLKSLPDPPSDPVVLDTPRSNSDSEDDDSGGMGESPNTSVRHAADDHTKGQRSDAPEVFSLGLGKVDGSPDPRYDRTDVALQNHDVNTDILASQSLGYALRGGLEGITLFGISTDNTGFDGNLSHDVDEQQTGGEVQKESSVNWKDEETSLKDKTAEIIDTVRELKFPLVQQADQDLSPELDIVGSFSYKGNQCSTELIQADLTNQDPSLKHLDAHFVASQPSGDNDGNGFLEERYVFERHDISDDPTIMDTGSFEPTESSPSGSGSQGLEVAFNHGDDLKHAINEDPNEDTVSTMAQLEESRSSGKVKNDGESQSSESFNYEAAAHTSTVSPLKDHAAEPRKRRQEDL